MRLKLYKLFIYLISILVCSSHPITAENINLSVDSEFKIHSKKNFEMNKYFNSSSNDVLNFNIKGNLHKVSSQLSFNFHKNGNVNLDRSHINYTSGELSFGIGSLNRHWSFSRNTSLILTNNARPIKSINFKLANKFQNRFSKDKFGLTLEVFNGINKNTYVGGDSYLLGARATISPFSNLDFEFIQTSQWGGKNHKRNLSSLAAALVTDTNDNANANINKMAGFGFSYKLKNNFLPFRVYGQAIGEDESGSLPSCYAHLIGFEWQRSDIKYPTLIGIETVDTRIKKTEFGNCGANSFYNNTVYKYTNHGVVMGTSIDTEGKSVELFGNTRISNKVSIKYSTKIVTINDKNWSSHRLSSKKETGSISMLALSWKQNNIHIYANVFQQGFNLDKSNISKGSGVSFSASYKF